MKLTFIGAAHEVTGSCTLLEACGKQVLIDCGMEQGKDLFENIEIPVSPDEIDAVCVTHAHIDHTGKLPFLVAHGYNGPIYSTEATHQLCDIMLRDSAHIQEFEAEWRNKKARESGAEEFVPLYTMVDAENTIKLFKPNTYGKEIKLFDGITIKFIDAGHLMGSSNILFTIKEDGVEKTVLFSGDLGNINKPLIRDPQDPPRADYVICESTYGDREHEESPDYVAQIAAVIQETFDRGGNVVIPSFAVGRTQELLYFIREIKDRGLIKNHDNFPVYVDSPLSVEATTIYSTVGSDYYDEEADELLKKGINPVTFDNLKVSVTADDSKAIIFDGTPKVIISASGMCDAGRIRHHLKNNLWRPECTILFVGYQSPGTVGAKLLDGAETIKLFGDEVEVAASIKRIEAFSSHADKSMLLDWLKIANPRQRLFINHGEDQVAESFCKLAGETINRPSYAPYSGDVWDLATDELAYKATVIPVIKKTAQGGIQAKLHKENKDADNKPGKKYYKITNSTGKSVTVYQELLSAGSDLMDLLKNSEGLSNKETEAFTREIKELIKRHK